LYENRQRLLEEQVFFLKEKKSVFPFIVIYENNNCGKKSILAKKKHWHGTRMWFYTKRTGMEEKAE
jgi:hypothetical protein